MENRIKQYHRGERISNFLFFCYGASCTFFGIAIYLLRPSELSLGLLFGFSFIGMVQMLVGSVRFYRSFRLYKLSCDSLSTDKKYLKEIELDRLEKLDIRFQKMRGIETTAFIIGFLLIITCALMNTGFIYLGTGAGITLHAAVLLVFDLFAQFKTREYKYQLKKAVD